MKILEIILSILSGLIVCIPLCVKLVNVTRETIREKNWNLLVKRIAHFMTEAEVMYDDEHNYDRKQFVLHMVRDTSNEINYNLTEEDMDKVSSLIDILCTMARTVNGPESNIEEIKIGGKHNGN